MMNKLDLLNKLELENMFVIKTLYDKYTHSAKSKIF